MVVFAIVALLAAAATQGFRSLRKADLREATTHLSGAMRYLFDRASTTGKIHRLVIDMETGRYWAEVSDDRFFIPREETESEQALRARGEGGEDDEEDGEEARAGRARGRERQVGVRQLELRPVEAGGRRLPSQARAVRRVQGPGAQAGEAQEDEGPERLHPARHRPADQRARATSTSSRSGRPSRRSSRCRTGRARPCYSLVVHPITGRVRIYNQEVQPPGGAPPTTKADG